MRMLAAVISFSCVFAIPAFAKPTYPDAAKECNAATGEESINACEDLLKSRRFKGHLLAIVHNNLGVAYSRMSDYEHAIDAFSHALQIEPRYVTPRVNRAKNLAAVARFADAIADMDAAIKLASTADNYALRGDFRDRNSDLEGAIGDYAEAIKRQPATALYYQNRAQIHLKLSQHTEAIEDFSRAIQLNSRDPALYFARGLAWANAGKCDEALPDYAKAIELSPRYSSAYNNRGVCLARAGKRDEAIADYEAALKWEPGNELARHNLAGAKNTNVPPAIPPIIEVPKFEIPRVQEILKVPEYSIEVAPASSSDKAKE
jgi:tetratricopeptide (TPR) repeat protein